MSIDRRSVQREPTARGVSAAEITGAVGKRTLTDDLNSSYQLGECSFDVIALTGAIVERPTMTSSIPTIVGAYTGGPCPSTFLSRYGSRVTTLRSLSRTTLTMPPPTMGFPF